MNIGIIASFGRTGIVVGAIATMMFGPAIGGEAERGVAYQSYAARDYAKTVTLIEPLVAEGDRWAIGTQGMMYQYGLGYREDAFKARALLMRVQGDRPASDAALAALLISGSGGTADTALAARLLTRWIDGADATGSIHFWYAVWLLHHQPQGQPAQATRAIEHGNRAIELNVPDGYLIVADAYVTLMTQARDQATRKEMTRNAADYFAKAADAGVGSDARRKFAILSRGDTRRTTTATLVRFAEAGDPRSTAELAQRALDGFAFREDSSAIAKWAAKAAERGEAQGNYVLGRAYADGLGVPKDTAQSLGYFKRAAEGGYDAGYLEVARLYMDGTAKIPQDLVSARDWLMRGWARSLSGDWQDKYKGYVARFDQARIQAQQQVRRDAATRPIDAGTAFFALFAAAIVIGANTPGGSSAPASGSSGEDWMAKERERASFNRGMEEIGRGEWNVCGFGCKR